VEYLFSDHDLHAVQEHQRQVMVAEINNSPATVAAGRPPEDIAAEFVQRFRLDTPELTEGAISMDVEEVQVDVSGDWQRGIVDRSRPFYIPGFRVTYYVPFRGDKDLLTCAPSTYTTTRPAVDTLGDHELELVYELSDTNIAGTKARFDHDLAEIKQYLGWVRQNAETFNQSLPAEALRLVTARQARLLAVQQSAGSMSVPIRRAGSPPAANSIASGTTQVRSTPQVAPVEIYDVALSFAGEQREYVEQVATGLRDAGVSVFYDTFERADLWGRNLVDHLAGIYQKRSRYVVMFISREYVEKAWTTHERQHAQARALVAKEEYILPARFDDTEVPGMTNTVGHIDLRQTLPAEFVALILKKLGRDSSR
jgi:hypothetical protein